MQPIIICDSGLGGLDIAASLFRPEQPSGELDVIFFNAYPDDSFGYNTLPSQDAQLQQLRLTLESMTRFNPSQCIIACNTLSILYQKLAETWKPPFPVVGIVNTAVDLMSTFMSDNPDAHLLILGTKTTVESRVYSDALLARGISPERVSALACPGLATLLELDPAAPEVHTRIQNIATQAKALLPAHPKHLALSFCCTHFGYATPIWSNVFAPLTDNLSILNPNNAFKLPGTGATCTYVARRNFVGNQQETMANWFDSSAPVLAQALRNATITQNLFPIVIQK